MYPYYPPKETVNVSSTIESLVDFAISHGTTYRKLKEGAAETVRSIIIMVNAQLRLCELPEIRRIFEDDDLDLPSLGLGVGKTKKKTALFLVMRSGDTSH